LEAGPAGSFGGDPSKEAGATGLVVGRLGMGDSKRVGSPARASSSRLRESGSRSSSEMVGMKEDMCMESTSKWGDTGSIQVSLAQEGKVPFQSSPVMVGKELCLKTLVSSRLGKRAAITEPIKLQVYQRSRWRFSKPMQFEGVMCSTGQPSGQLAPRGLLGATPSVSPVRLDFDGDEVESRELGDVPSSAGILGATSNSDEVVPESGDGADSAGTGMSGANPVVAEKLNHALEVGEVEGMTCEGQTDQLKEVLGKIVAENHGRGIGGERGSHVFNES
jgi:hypothetical protein